MCARRSWGTWVLAGLLLPGAAGRTIYVHGTSGDDGWDGLCYVWDGGTCGPKRTIQAGIDVAVAGDEVLLAPVTYTGDGNRDCDFNGTAITVRSLDPDDPVIVAWTVIDCEAGLDNWHRGFTIANGEGRDSVLAGLTIQNGCAPLNYSPPPFDGWFHEGGAIAIKGASPTIDRCMFYNNASFGAGGGAIISNGVTGPDDAGAPYIVGCGFVGNANRAYGDSCGFGGAVDCDGGSPVIAASWFAWNRSECAGAATDVGGGALMLWRCAALVQDCWLYRNGSFWTALRGGALFCSASTVTLVNCVISGNEVPWGGSAGAVYATDDTEGGGNGSDVTLIDCVLAGNRATYGGAFSTRTLPGNDSTLRLINCTVLGNRGNFGSVLDWRYGGVEIANSLIWNDIDWWGSGACTIQYSDVPGGWPGAGNISAEPLWVDPGHWEDNGTPDDPGDDWWVNGDYRLLSGSPGIDAGSNAAVPRDAWDFDADGCFRERIPLDAGWVARFQDDPATPDSGYGGPPLVDMGAYEFGAVPPPNPAACDGDLNCDGVLDFGDINPFVLAVQSYAGYQTQYPDCFYRAADVNADGYVNFDDINPFVGLLTGG